MKHYKCAAALILCLTLLAGTVLAAGPVEDAEPAELTLQYACEEIDVKDTLFRIYRIASRTEKDGAVMLAPFSGYGTEPGNDTAADLSELAYTLKGYVLRDNVEPDAEGTTDENGILVIEDLIPGLYLVVGESITGDDGYLYTPYPFIAALPEYDDEHDAWLTEATVHVKCERTELCTELRVLKVWDDKGFEAKRPESVKLDLLCDGEIFETVEIGPEENWRYCWKELPVGHEWLVTESEPGVYTVTCGNVKGTVTVTNKYPEIEPPPEKPTDDIPQTGLIWWPVPVLAAAGIVCLIIGRARKKHEKD